MHDSIVVFDRVRENVKRAEAAGLRVSVSDAVNASLNQTLGRSLNTSITVVLTLVALILLGGDTVRDFLIIMLIGLVSGTYSSIFVASQLLVSWDEGDLPRLFGRHDRAQRPRPARLVGRRCSRRPPPGGLGSPPRGAGPGGEGSAPVRFDCIEVARSQRDSGESCRSTAWSRRSPVTFFIRPVLGRLTRIC